MIDSKNLQPHDFILRIVPEIRKLSEKLTQETDICFSSLIINHCDGTSSDLCACPKEWIEHSYKKYDIATVAKHRLVPGINYWKQNTNQHISNIAEDARNNFDIDARIDFIYQDVPNNKYYQYSFFASRKNADKAYRFYDLHRTKLLRYIKNFNDEASHLITEAQKPENKVFIPSYIPLSMKKIKRDYISEMKAVNASCKLSDREFEIMILFASGCTAKQIAKMFHVTPSAIESHILKIREKTNCQDRMMLHRYVVEKGYSGLERFFFPYIPSSN